MSQFRIPGAYPRFAAKSRLETEGQNPGSDSAFLSAGMRRNQALQHELELMGRVRAQR